MKKTLILILILVMICSLCACTFPAEIQVENPDGSQTVAGAVIKQAVLLFFSALGTGITFIGGWVLRLLGRNTKLKNLVLRGSAFVMPHSRLAPNSSRPRLTK